MMIPILDTHDDLCKGQSQMISKQQQGNRMVYIYMLPDGTKKTVTKPLKSSVARPKEPKEEKPSQKHQPKQEERPVAREPKQIEASPSKKETYLPLPEHEFVGKLMNIQRSNVSTDREMDSWTGIPLKWKVYDSNNKELHIMTGKKFRLSVFFNKMVENPYAISLRVENITSGEPKPVYGKKVMVDLTTFEDTVADVLSKLSFLQVSQDAIPACEEFAKSNTSRYLDEIEKFLDDTKEGVDASFPISILEFALESRYFKKKVGTTPTIFTGN